MAEDNGKTFEWNAEEVEIFVESTDEDDAVQKSIEIIKRYQDETNTTPKVLEAGCGNGRVLIYLMRKGFKNLYGVEINSEIVKAIKEKYPDLNIFEGNILELNNELMNNDVVLSYGVVEHFLSGIQKPLKATLDSISNNGYAVITVPCLNIFRQIQAFFNHSLFYDKKKYKFYPFMLENKFFEYRLTPKQFRKECLKAGFEIIEQIPTANTFGIVEILNPKNKHGHIMWYDNRYNFHYSILGKILFKLMSKIPFFGSHMQLCVLKKSKNSDTAVKSFDKCYISQTTFINNPQCVKMGENCWIGDNCRIFANPPGTTLGNNVIMAHNITIINNFHNYKKIDMLPFDYRGEARPVYIGDNVWVGMHSIILPGVKIDEGAIVGAGSVVSKSVPKCAIVAGNPAQIVGWRDEATYDMLKQQKAFIDVFRENQHPEMIIINEFKSYLEFNKKDK